MTRLRLTNRGRMSRPLFKFQKLQRRIARFAAVVAFLTGINLFCVYCLPAHIDLTRRGRFTLAPQTRNLLAALQTPVEVTILCPKVPKSAGEHNFRQAAVMFRDMLQDCRRLQPLLRVQELDAQESAAGRQLQQHFPDVASPCVLITYGLPGAATHEILSARDLAEFRVGPDRRLVAIEFFGEQALAAALARLTAGGKTAVFYVATGHGELALDDDDRQSRRGMGRLAQMLRELDCAVRPLDLTAMARVPYDATVVMIPGGEQAWDDAQTQKLGQYLRQGGKAFVLADLNYDPQERQPVANGFEELLAEFGVAIGNDRVITRGITGQVEVASPALPAAGDHPLVRSLPQSPVTLFECRSLRSSTALKQVSTRAVPLLVSHAAPRAWADGDFVLGQLPEPGGENDSDGPVVMAMAVERQQGEQALPALVVVGDAEFVSNRVLSEPAGRVNASFVLSCLNWLRGRRELLGDVPPRRAEGYRLTGSPEAHRGLVWKSSLVLWSLIVTVGATVWTSRRRG